ncbi:MAG: tRNA nucleotidyltransferase [Proteobacteria bacterium]|nr:tRNA nucleotidyltransferase [Pseudomonadota bacterium]
MGFDFASSPLGVLIACPAANVLRIAALAAAPDGALDADTVSRLKGEVERGVLIDFDHIDAWPELARGLMGEAPSRMLRALRDSGALAALLPELDALFGMPQADNNGEVVDIGEHQLAVADEMAKVGAPLAVRFAGLLYNLGKADSPPQHLPSHYRHVDRGLPRVQAVCARFRVSAEFTGLALLATAELERIHRAAEMRAGSIAALLERVDAFGQSARYSQLMTLCAADYRAFPGAAPVYPKAALLDTALRACAGLVADPAADDPAAALLEARAKAIARALRSERWAEQE